MAELRAERFVDGGSWAAIPQLVSLVPEWHREAACAGEQDENVFFTEVAGSTVRPHLQSPTLLLAMLICAGCPVRARCLTRRCAPWSSPAHPAHRYPHRLVWGVPFGAVIGYTIAVVIVGVLGAVCALMARMKRPM